MGRVTYLQVKVIAFLAEYPIGLLGGQSGGEDTKRTNHTFQLFHGFVVESRSERAKQWRHLSIGHQHLKDGFVTLIQEGQNMRHIAVLAQPVGRFYNVSCRVTDYACRFYHTRLRVNGLVVVHLVTIGIVGTLLVVAEEVDTCCQEVDRRSLEELVATATAFLLTLL